MFTPTPEASRAVKLAWHPTTDLLAVATLESQVVIWSVRAEAVVARKSITTRADSLAWSPDGGALAIGTSDQAVTIWQPTTDTSVTLPIYSADGIMELQLAWSSTGVLATAAGDKRISLWDVDAGTITHQFDGREWPRQIAWSPDGTMLACTNYDDATLVWDPFNKSLVEYVAGDDNYVSSIAWAPDGNRIALAGVTLQLWSPQGRFKAVIVDALESPPAVAWSPDGTQVATTEYGTTHVWDPATGDEVREFVGFMSDQPTIAYSADGTMLAYANASAPRVWNSMTRTTSMLVDPETLVGL